MKAWAAGVFRSFRSWGRPAAVIRASYSTGDLASAAARNSDCVCVGHQTFPKGKDASVEENFSTSIEASTMRKSQHHSSS